MGHRTSKIALQRAKKIHVLLAMLTNNFYYFLKYSTGTWYYHRSCKFYSFKWFATSIRFLEFVDENES